MLSVETQNQYSPEKGVYEKPLKTKDSARILSIPDVVLNLLKIYKNESNLHRERLHNQWKGESKEENRHLFTTFLGMPAHPDSFATWLRRFVVKHDFPAISPHSFRHMSASYLIAAGLDLTTAAGRLGHNNSTTTQVVYAHLLKTTERKSAEIMNDILTSCRKDGENEN